MVGFGGGVCQILVIGVLLKCLCQTLLAFPCVGSHVILSYTCGVHFDVLTLLFVPFATPPSGSD